MTIRTPLNPEDFQGTGLSEAHVKKFWDDYLEAVAQGNATEEAASMGLVGYNHGANDPDTTLAFNETTREVTLTPTGDSFSYWCGGVLYTIEDALSVVIDDEEGPHFVYLDGLELKSTQIFVPSLITTYAITSIIVWDKANGKRVKFAEERHGRVMGGETHLSLHVNPGTIFVHGGDLGSAVVASGAPSDDTSSKVYIDEATVRDEDINITSINSASPSGRFEQILGSNLTDDAAKLPVMSLEGVSGYWRKWDNDSDRFAFQHNGGNTPPYYNEFSGGSWGLAACPNRDFVVYYVCQWNDYNFPVFLKMGQQAYDRLEDAEAASATDLSWGMYDPAELIVLHKLVFEYRTTYTDATHRCVLRQVESYNVLGASKVAVLNPNQNHAALLNLDYGTSGHTGFQRASYSSASADPTSDNDEVDTADLGRVFTFGEIWYNISGDKLWFCADASEGAAVWKQIAFV